MTLFDLQYLLFVGEPRRLLVATIVYLVISFAIGNATRRPILEGTALGFMVLTAASNMAFYVSRPMELSLWAFSGLTIALTIGIIATLRAMPFPDNHPETRVHWPTIITVSAVWSIAWLTNIVMPEPSAAYAIFQGWYPLYIDMSVEFSRFPLENDVKLGHGIVMQTLFYAADILGPATFLVHSFGLESNAAVYGAHISAVLLTLAVLTASLNRNPVALALFIVATLAFFRWGHAYRTVLGDNWGDNLLFLAGALVCYYLSTHARGRDALPAVAIAAAFFVFGRNFGAFFFAVIGLTVFTIDYFKFGFARLKTWIAVAVLGSIFAAKELSQIALHGLYYPRAALDGATSLDFTERLLAIATDLGLIQNNHIFDAAIPAALISAVVLVVTVIIRKAKGISTGTISLYAFPLLAFLPPILLEFVTGYRQNLTASKLFIGTIFFLSWYPAYLASLVSVKVSLPQLQRRTRYLALAMLIGLTGVGLLGIDRVIHARAGEAGLAAYIERAFDSYRQNNPDLQIAAMIEGKGETTADKIRERPILYLHYEPGMSLRYFLGGGIVNDYDFWSDPVQDIIKSASTFEDVLRALDWPNISVGHRNYVTIHREAAYPQWEKFRTDIEQLKDQPWVDETLSSGPSFFYITAPL